MVYFAEGRKYPKLILDGYDFKLHLRNPDCSVWACTQHAKYKCKVRLVTTGQRVTVKSIAHSHNRTYTESYEGLKSHRVEICYTDRIQIRK